ncbi:MAG: sulfite exporter TauE/SafE family protein [Aggregatilineales bacterium]
MAPETIFIFVVVALLVGLSKGGLGGPVPVSLTTPLLSLVLSKSEAVALVLPLLMFADVFALYFYWGKWDMRYLRLMLPSALLGILLGTLLLATLPDDVLGRIIGAFTLIAVIYKLSNNRIPTLKYSPRAWHGYFAGWASGFGSSLANAGAPPFTAYMLLQPNMNPVMFIGTATLFFAIVNALKLIGYISADVMDINLLLSIAWTAPLVPFGVWLGRRIIERMEPKIFENLMMVLLFLAGIYLLFF